MSEDKKRIRPVVEEVGSEPSKEEAKPAPFEAATTPMPEENTSSATELSTPIEEPKEASVAETNPADSSSDGPKVKKKTNFKLILIITILTALVVGFVAGGVYVYFTGVKQAQDQPQVEATSTPEPTVTPTPSPTPEAMEEDVDLSVYELSILNGSGKIGEAGKARDVVEGAGFTVSKTGNAASFDFDSTIIEHKADVPKSVVSKLKTALEASYTVEVGDELTDSSEYDIVITVGAK